MKHLRRFLSLVPRTVQFWALVLAICPLPAMLVAAYESAQPGALLRTMLTYGSGALLFGAALGTWLLCLGFVYVDARRRDMRPVAWVLVAALFPHLLGFLLYFVMRQPIAQTCGHCGLSVPNHQPFCSWCGAAQFPTNSTTAPLTAGPPQQTSQ